MRLHWQNPNLGSCSLSNYWKIKKALYSGCCGSIGWSVSWSVATLLFCWQLCNYKYFWQPKEQVQSKFEPNFKVHNKKGFGKSQLYIFFYSNNFKVSGEFFWKVLLILKKSQTSCLKVLRKCMKSPKNVLAKSQESFLKVLRSVFGKSWEVFLRSWESVF